MPNMKHLEVLGLDLVQWARLTDEEKVVATKKAAQIINDSHYGVTITHDKPKINDKSKDDKSKDDKSKDIDWGGKH
jgi:hypothetical protein